MVPTDLPAWLLKRANDLHATRLIPVLHPNPIEGEVLRGPGIYLLDFGAYLELHVTQSIDEPSDGATITLNHREAGHVLANLAGAISGRLRGMEFAKAVSDGRV